MASALTKLERKEAKSLAQARRDKLVARHLASPKSKKGYLLYSGSVLYGDEVVMVGKNRINHFFACEGDPDIHGVEYGPVHLSVRLDSTEQKVRFDTIVRFKDNQREFRVVRMNRRQTFEIQERAAKELGGAFRVIEKAWLKQHGLRILNWRRALAAHRICKRSSYAHVKGHILQLLMVHRRMSFGALLLLYSKENRPYVLASLVELISSRQVISDLDYRPWSLHTTVSLPGGAA